MRSYAQLESNSSPTHFAEALKFAGHSSSLAEWSNLQGNRKADDNKARE
jgi:hypothetical protein